MTKVKYKHFDAIRYGDRIPRKAKLAILGRRESGAVVRRRLRNVRIVEACKTMYQRTVTNTGLFCPKCGCGAYYGTGNKTQYPEHWEYFYCMRCRFMVGMIDNSPFISCLEYPNFNFELI